MEPPSSRTAGGNNASSQGHKYRRLGPKESVDDTLFGSSRAQKIREGGDRSRQAGRYDSQLDFHSRMLGALSVEQVIKRMNVVTQPRRKH